MSDEGFGCVWCDRCMNVYCLETEPAVAHSVQGKWSAADPLIVLIEFLVSVK